MGTDETGRTTPGIRSVPICDLHLCRSVSKRQAFLLVEASLTAAVIVVGVVFVSRGMASSLHAFSRLQEIGPALRCAQTFLNELEAMAQQAGAVSAREGACGQSSPDDSWALTTQPLPADIVEVSPEAFWVVTVTVSRQGSPRSLARLETIWPRQWVAQ